MITLGFHILVHTCTDICTHIRVPTPPHANTHITHSQTLLWFRKCALTPVYLVKKVGVLLVLMFSLCFSSFAPKVSRTECVSERKCLDLEGVCSFVEQSKHHLRERNLSKQIQSAVLKGKALSVQVRLSSLRTREPRHGDTLPPYLFSLPNDCLPKTCDRVTLHGDKNKGRNFTVVGFCCCYCCLVFWFCFSLKNFRG